MATFASLPPETVDRILSFALLDRSTTRRPQAQREQYPAILHFSLVSSEWNYLCQAILHRHITLETQVQARQLTLSPALGRHRVVELVLAGNGGSSWGLDNFTAREVVAKAGTVGLQSLTLRSFHRLEASILSLVGPDFESLCLATDLVGTKPVGGWPIALHLRHLEWRGRVTPPDLISTILTSSIDTLRSIDISGNFFEPTLVGLFDLPSFAATAARLTSLSLHASSHPYIKIHTKIFQSFTSLLDLTFTATAVLLKLVDVLDNLPSQEPTIERLTLRIRSLTLRNRDELRVLLKHKTMVALKELVFGDVAAPGQAIVQEMMHGEFPAVRLIWGGVEPPREVYAMS